MGLFQLIRPHLTKRESYLNSRTSYNITTNHMIANYLYSHHVWVAVK